MSYKMTGKVILDVEFSVADEIKPDEGVLEVWLKEDLQEQGYTVNDIKIKEFKVNPQD